MFWRVLAAGRPALPAAAAAAGLGASTAAAGGAAWPSPGGLPAAPVAPGRSRSCACQAPPKVAAPKYVVAIDQGTTSSRAILFDRDGKIAAVSQQEFTQYYPKPGWAEHDPMEIVRSVEETVAAAMKKVGATAADVAAIGITNQRETTVAWDRETGKPLYNAVVWLDTRTAETVEKLKGNRGQDRYRESVGLPISTYFSGVKMRWLMDEVPAVAKAVKEGRCMFGTIDAWLTYNLTGGKDGGVYLTDVTNASRTMLMNLAELRWDKAICKDLGVPLECLPEIRSNSEELGRVKTGPLAGVPITCSLGDQHAALLGQGCLGLADVKSTYGTGCFIVMNTGEKMMPSSHGLLTTMGFKLGKDAPTIYALEGAVGTAGRGVQWLRDSLKMIKAAPEISTLAGSVDSTEGVTFVPAFSGLLAPHWRPNARGALLGLSLYSTDAHIARAMLEGIAFQATDVMRAMEKDAGISKFGALKVDGGLTASDLAMQIQADLLGTRLLRAKMPEATALGAAFAAGLAVGFWKQPSDITRLLEMSGGADEFAARSSAAERAVANKRWQDAVAMVVQAS